MSPASIGFLSMVDVRGAVEWIEHIPFTDWPQQHRLDDGNIRPAMVKDVGWYGFGEVVQPMIDALSAPGTHADNLMLSAVMPGHSIPAHADVRAAHALYRIHVPLLTNAKACFIIEGQPYQLKVGRAYRINTEAEHSVVNDGVTPRVHFMFDLIG